MNKSANDVPYLDRTAIEHEIQTIVKHGMDPKTAFWRYLWNMYKQIGLRFIFKDATEILFSIILSLFVLFAFITGLSGYVTLERVNWYSIIFIWSPVTYLLFAYFFFLHQKEKDTFEVEMTCKYNLHQLAAFRMLIFSVVSMILNSVIIFIFIAQHELNFLMAVLLSSSSLFLFALLFLRIQLHTQSHRAKVGLFFVWLFGNLIASYYSSQIYLQLLQQVPFYVYGIITIGCACLYIKSLKSMLIKKGWISC